MLVPSCHDGLNSTHVCLRLSLFTGTVAKHYGWQWGMWAPGAFGLVMGTVLLFVLKDKPEDAGDTRATLSCGHAPLTSSDQLTCNMVTLN